ncbi:hypothetical protein GCM10010425_18620 [Streptomyces spororaveus]|uniref:Uncharacterized protein n=1 Tax=Streptomyces spororaveus TaxID=284039 RepID=A0ABQ3T7R6_9ACTN|nr:hypothetical protein Sspor_20060 [Streptomyces spororaveus]
MEAGRTVGLGDDRVPELRGRTAQPGRALAGVRHEGGQIDQVPRSADPCDHRPSVGVAENERGLRQCVDGGLDGVCVSGQ